MGAAALYLQMRSAHTSFSESPVESLKSGSFTAKFSRIPSSRAAVTRQSAASWLWLGVYMDRGV